MPVARADEDPGHRCKRLCRACSLPAPGAAGLRRAGGSPPRWRRAAGLRGSERRDVGPDTQWHRALEGIDAVAHLAARVHVMHDTSADPLADFRRVNVQGTVRLAQAAAQARVKRLVFVSSVKVNGESSVRPFTESDAPRPVDAYAISKFEAEQALAQAAEATALEYVILRTPLVYGPGVKANFLRLDTGSGAWHAAAAGARAKPAQPYLSGQSGRCDPRLPDASCGG